MTRPLRLLLTCVGLCLMAQLLPAGAFAQTSEIDQLRADRDRVREDRARAAADLDPLIAANDEIEAALALLTEDLAARRADLEATRSRLEKARLDVIAAQDEVVLEQQKIADLRVQLQRQAITAYVQPRGDGAGEEVLSANDLNEGERRRALMLAVQTSQSDILDQLRIAEANRELAVARAEAAQQDIAAREAIAVEQLAEVDAAIVRQQRLQTILDQRIADFQDEIDSHAADEDQLTAQITGLIAEEEARQAAIREAARIQAERERVAAEEARLAAERAADVAAGRTPVADTTVSRADAALVGAPAVSAGSLSWPVQGSVSSAFGPRWGRQHNGLDIEANTGTTVTAAGSGTVVGAGNSGGFGNMIIVDHGGGLVTAYAHLSSINVSVGQRVSSGTAIGAVGCTGSCTGPHLHFETRVNGVAYDPYSYIG